jgi:deazaflavin-dependent oxidoreductase (nitroreductase family)
MVVVMTALVSILAALLVSLVVGLGAFLGGMHFKWTPVVNAVRRLNLRVMNPRQMETAGQPGAYAQVLRHRGRSSGKTYETPLGIEPIQDGFVIALVYGNDSQWLKNVLASGTAEVVVDGHSYLVDRPEVVPLADVIDAFKGSDRPLFRLFGVDRCLLLHRAESE